MKKVALGRVVMTMGINDKMENNQNFRSFTNNCLQRHKMGDWGDLSDEDKSANDEALLVSDSLLSVYHYSDGTKIWIITSRSITTIFVGRTLMIKPYRKEVYNENKGVNMPIRGNEKTA